MRSIAGWKRFFYNTGALRLVSGVIRKATGLTMTDEEFPPLPFPLNL